MTNFIEKLEGLGYSTEEAEAQIAKVRTVIEKAMAGSTPQAIEAVINKKMRELTNVGRGVKRLDAICIAMGDRVDRNDYTRKKAMEAYESDPTAAIASGLIGIVKGQPVPLDNREYVDAAQTKENRNYGKPLRSQFKREFYLITKDLDEEGKQTGDEVLVRAFGDVDLVEGHEVVLFGSWNGGDAILNIRESPAPITRGEVPDVWERLQTIGEEGNNPMFVDLDAADEIEPKSNIVGRGFVKAISEISTGSMLIIEGAEGLIGGVAVFCNSDRLNEDAASGEIQKEDDIIVLGRFDSSTDNDGNVRYNINAIGYLKNPNETVVDTSVMDQINSQLFG
jgi:hypothetical protein